MDIFTIYLVMVFVVALSFGAFAQASQFCPVGGLRETVNKQGSHRLWAYFAAIAVALIGVNLIAMFAEVDLDAVRPNYRSEAFPYGRYIIGGFIFGFGMVLSSGCGMRNLIRVGQGSLKAILMVVIMAITAYIMVKTSFFAEYILPMVSGLSFNFSETGSQEITSLLLGGKDNSTASAKLFFAVAIGLVILFYAFRNPTFRQARYWVSAIGIGLVITAGFYITGTETGLLLMDEAEFMEVPPLGLGVQSFSFAAPMADTVYAVINPGTLAVVTFGVVAVIGLPIGALLASIVRKEFKLELNLGDKKTFAYSALGAVMVGFGSVLAMGCSVGHGLTGISTLALGSVLALIAIGAGAYVGIKIENKL